MANDYASNFGDVVKHTVLGAAIEDERPTRYMESHGGRLDYDLAGLVPGRGGVWDFLEVSAQNPALEASAYAKLLRRLAGTADEPGVYPGSVALADALLPKGTEVLAFDLVESSAASMRDGLAIRGRPATVTVGDGLQGVVSMARQGDLVLLDPFQVTDAGPAGLNSVDVFAVLAERSVATLLWYGLFQPSEPIDWTQDVRGRLERPLWRVEFSCRDAAAGLAGCGVLAANLAERTETELTRLASDLGHALQTKVAGLRFAVAQSQDEAHPIWHPFGARHASASDVR
jgi:23S rRNA A2030 N6-methylase RlmJ